MGARILSLLALALAAVPLVSVAAAHEDFCPAIGAREPPCVPLVHPPDPDLPPTEVPPVEVPPVVACTDVGSLAAACVAGGSVVAVADPGGQPPDTPDLPIAQTCLAIEEATACADAARGKNIRKNITISLTRRGACTATQDEGETSDALAAATSDGCDDPGTCEDGAHASACMKVRPLQDRLTLAFESSGGTLCAGTNAGGYEVIANAAGGPSECGAVAEAPLPWASICHEAGVCARASEGRASVMADVLP